MSEARSKRIIVGLSGASGAVYALRMIEVLCSAGAEVFVVATAPGLLTLKLETGHSEADLRALAAHYFRADAIAAPLASGSFPIDAMVVCPCSMRTLAAIAHGYDDNLLTRAASVSLKERRPLVLMPREAPLHLVQLRNLVSAAEAGAVILPPTITFYSPPINLDAAILACVQRALPLLGLPAQAEIWSGAT